MNSDRFARSREVMLSAGAMPPEARAGYLLLGLVHDLAALRLPDDPRLQSVVGDLVRDPSR